VSCPLLAALLAIAHEEEHHCEDEEEERAEEQEVLLDLLEKRAILFQPSLGAEELQRLRKCTRRAGVRGRAVWA
jgi:hypothetical protein